MTPIFTQKVKYKSMENLEIKPYRISKMWPDSQLGKAMLLKLVVCMRDFEKAVALIDKQSYEASVKLLDPNLGSFRGERTEKENDKLRGDIKALIKRLPRGHYYRKLEKLGGLVDTHPLILMEEVPRLELGDLCDMENLTRPLLEIMVGIRQHLEND